ncbi:t-complex protein 1 subunit delta [Trichonephila clavipes]|nr:t-complex protein 1 subunit delta [Trichonephila clavipes]
MYKSAVQNGNILIYLQTSPTVTVIKKSKSRAWEHFGLPANESGQILSEDIAVCKLCRPPVSAKSGSTSNLFGHLRLHHPLKFSEVSNKSKVVTATVQYSPFCAAVDESTDEPQPHSNMAVSESNQLNFVDNHMHKRQKFMTDFQRLDDQTSKRTTDSVTKFLVCTMQPYNLVDRKEFINMVKVLNPCYSLPGRKHFTATAVPKLYNEVRDKTQKTSNPDNFENIETRTKKQNKKRLAKFFYVFGSNSNSENTRSSSQEAEKELNEYLSMPRVPFEHDPLDWWKVHYKSFPSLKVLARKYLCVFRVQVWPRKEFSVQVEAL